MILEIVLNSPPPVSCVMETTAARRGYARCRHLLAHLGMIPRLAEGCGGSGGVTNLAAYPTVKCVGLLKEKINA